jgi:hypothetical protein
MKMKAISVILPPGHGENHMGITLVSCYENLSVTLTCDAS